MIILINQSFLAYGTTLLIEITKINGVLAASPNYKSTFVNLFVCLG